jgi:hypothetical protein
VLSAAIWDAKISNGGSSGLGRVGRIIDRVNVQSLQAIWWMLSCITTLSVSSSSNSLTLLSCRKINGLLGLALTSLQLSALVAIDGLWSDKHIVKY